MTYTNSLSILIWLWQMGIVDTLTFLQMGSNFVSQYGIIAAADAFGNVTLENGLAPLAGFGTAFKFIKQPGIPASERTKRIAMLASYLSMSGTNVIAGDIPTNVATGGAIATYIAHMKSILEKTNSTGSVPFVMLMKDSLTPTEQVVVMATIIGTLVVIYISIEIIKYGWKLGQQNSSNRVIKKRNKHKLTTKIQKFLFFRRLVKLIKKTLIHRINSFRYRSKQSYQYLIQTQIF